MTPGPAPADAPDLIRQIALGREVALSRLIALHGRGLTLFAARFLGSPAEADEVVQDTFLQVWQQAARYDPARGAVSTWLYRIAASRCIDRQRRARVRRFLGLGGSVDDLADVLADPAPGAFAQVAASQRLAQVRRALHHLPDRQRMALLLSAVAGMDTGEIGAIMGASPGAVEQLLVRARKALRDRLPDDDADDTRPDHPADEDPR